MCSMWLKAAQHSELKKPLNTRTHKHIRFLFVISYVTYVLKCIPAGNYFTRIFNFFPLPRAC